LTLTPQSEAILSEASRFADLFGASLTVIHTGTSEAESQLYLDEAAERLAISHEKNIIWNQSDPADALLQAAKKCGIDLLVAGAFDGPTIGKRRFLGGVARQLASRIESSLLLIAHPRITPQPFRRIVVITDYSDASRTAMESALWLAQKDRVDCIHVVSIFSPFMKARAEVGLSNGTPARTRGGEEKLLEIFLDPFSKTDLPLDSRIIDATTGFAACDFVESIGADLLILPSQNRPEGHVPPMTDWAMQVLPCSLWVVRGGHLRSP
jgi:nucleotide-binding universal stress UspA family protein